MANYQEIDTSKIPPRHPVAVFAESWRNFTKVGPAPDWTTFDPIEHARILPWILLLRPEADGDLRYVICGEGYSQVIGLSLQGKLFGESLTPEIIERYRIEFARVQSTGTPLFTSNSVPLRNKEFVEVFRGMFPFLAADGALQRICIVVAPIRETCR